MATIILTTTPKPVRWFNKMTVSSEELGRTVNVTFYTDDEGVDADTIDTDNGYVPADVYDLLVYMKVDLNTGELSGPEAAE
jgi:hypothetical protein